MLLHEPGCGRRICGIEHRRSFWSRPRTRTRGLTERAAASRGRDGSLPGSPVADRGGQGTLRRPYLFGKVLTSPSYPLHGDRGPAGVAPNSLRWGFSVPSQADPDRGCDTARRLARTAPCRGLHSAGRLLSSSVPGVPSALALTELDPPRTGRVSGSPTGWIDVRCRKRACIACTPRMQLCVAVGRASSSTPPPRGCALGRRLFRLWSRSSAPARSTAAFVLARISAVRACPLCSTRAQGRHPTPPARRCVAGRALSPDRPAMRNERPARIRTAGSTTCADPIPAAPSHIGHVGRCRVRR